MNAAAPPPREGARAPEPVRFGARTSVRFGGVALGVALVGGLLVGSALGASLVQTTGLGDPPASPIPGPETTPAPSEAPTPSASPETIDPWLLSSRWPSAIVRLLGAIPASQLRDVSVSAPPLDGGTWIIQVTMDRQSPGEVSDLLDAFTSRLVDMGVDGVSAIRGGHGEAQRLAAPGLLIWFSGDPSDSFVIQIDGRILGRSTFLSPSPGTSPPLPELYDCRDADGVANGLDVEDRSIAVAIQRAIDARPSTRLAERFATAFRTWGLRNVFVQACGPWQRSGLTPPDATVIRRSISAWIEDGSGDVPPATPLDVAFRLVDLLKAEGLTARISTTATMIVVQADAPPTALSSPSGQPSVIATIESNPFYADQPQVWTIDLGFFEDAVDASGHLIPG